MTDQKLTSTPVVGAVFSPQASQRSQAIPEVERMRRGRLPASTQLAAQQPKTVQAKPAPSPSRSVTNGDPFAALDQKAGAQKGDELSSRFPTLDQFSILHESGTKFEFDDIPSAAPTQPPQQTKDLSQRVSERLADEVFQTPKPSLVPNQRQSVEINRSKPIPASSEPKPVPTPVKSASAPPKPSEMSRASAIISSTPELQAISAQAAQPLYQPAPTKPAMISTGTMTSTSPPERSTSTQQQYQIYKFPSNEHPRASSLPRQQEPRSLAIRRSETPGSSRHGAASKTSSFQSQPPQAPLYHASSSRPSLETGRPSLDMLESTARPPVQPPRPRPVSTHLESNIDYLREREAISKPLPSPGHQAGRMPEKDLPPMPAEHDDETNIESNVDFLRSMEESDPKKKDKAHKHSKRSSLNSIGAGTKNILAGKFGDAFKRFETNAGGQHTPRTPSPLKDLERRDLTPIAGSEATDGHSDDGHLREDLDEATPEMRREQEARMLAQEEARVAAAQAEYRQRVNTRGPGSGTGPTPLPKSIGGVSRAVSIQNKVQSLLDETTKSSKQVPRSAEGYGHFSDAAVVASRPPAAKDGRPPIPRKPLGAPQPGVSRVPTGGAGRPMAPPKPTHLNTIPPIPNATSISATGGRPGSPPKPSMPSNSISASKLRGGGASLERLVAMDLPGQPVLDGMTTTERDDYIRDFQKRFPSLTSIEMVERDLTAEAGGRSSR